MSIHTETIGEYRIRIELDDGAESPRENDNLGTMVYFHRRHTLGDVDGDREYGNNESFLRTLAAQAGTPLDTGEVGMATVWKILNRHFLILPLSIYDHSGVSMWVGDGPHACDSAGWDSGQVGWIYVSHAKIRKEWSVKSVRHCPRGQKKTAIRCAEECLRSEVKEFDSYLQGNVFGYIVERKVVEHVTTKTQTGEAIGTEDRETWAGLDSCWGFIGDMEYALSEAKAAIAARSAA